MSLRLAAAFAAILMVGVEIALPGRDVYHAGWYNVLLAACAIVALVGARAAFARAGPKRVGWAIAAVAFGAAIAGVAGIASGLLAPDNREIVGAPGETVRDDDLGGTLKFPLVAPSANRSPAPTVVLERSGRTPVAIETRARNIGSFVLRAASRDVIYVEARDIRGARLTITQPTGSAFLSPVLLLQQRQSISGMELPYDSFAVPAAHRIVKAILFTPRQAAALRGMAGAEIPAVLFAADDENDRPLPHAIALDPDGHSVAIGGLLLRAAVFAYPAVEVVAAPQLAITLVGSLLVIAGSLAELVWRRRKRPFL